MNESRGYRRRGTWRRDGLIAIAIAIALCEGACSLAFEVGPVNGSPDGGQDVGTGGGNPDSGQPDIGQPDTGAPDTGTPGTTSVPQYIDRTIADVAGTRDFSVNRPPGTRAGDLLLAAFYGNNETNTITPVPAGDWVMLHNGIMSNCTSLGMWAYRIVGASDASSYAFKTHDAAGPQTMAIVAYRGVDPTMPLSPGRPKVDVPGNASDYGPIDTTADAANSMLVMMALNDKENPGAPKWTPPSGMTKRVDNAILGIFDEPRLVAGKTEPRTATTTAEHCGAVVMVAIRPAPRSSASFMGSCINPRYGIDSFGCATGAEADGCRRKNGTYGIYTRFSQQCCGDVGNYDGLIVCSQ